MEDKVSKLMSGDWNVQLRRVVRVFDGHKGCPFSRDSEVAVVESRHGGSVLGRQLLRPDKSLPTHQRHRWALLYLGKRKWGKITSLG